MTIRTSRPRAAALRAVVAATLALAAAGTGCNTVTSTDELPGGDVGDIPAADTPAVVTFQALYDGYFQNCVSCHTPAGPGRVTGTETTLDLSTVQTAYATLTQGTAAGLIGNVESCNGVPLLGSTYETSLVVATIDDAVRTGFLATGQGQCDQAAVTDMTLKVGTAPSPAFLRDLKAWIDAGALQ
jgi:mono/diheme cytochrome c family protein